MATLDCLGGILTTSEVILGKGTQVETQQVPYSRWQGPQPELCARWEVLTQCLLAPLSGAVYLQDLPEDFLFPQ